MKKTKSVAEQDIFAYIEQVKDLLSPELWQNVLLDCSKNEILVLWLLYRSKEANMTQVADYIHVPLNTATGIISRMEKRKLVIRERSREDKRIVTIAMGEQGRQQIQAILEEFMYYGTKVLESFSAQEIQLFFSMLDKLLDIMQQKHSKEQGQNKTKVRRITIS